MNVSGRTFLRARWKFDLAFHLRHKLFIRKGQKWKKCSTLSQKHLFGAPFFEPYKDGTHFFIAFLGLGRRPKPKNAIKKWVPSPIGPEIEKSEKNTLEPWKKNATPFPFFAPRLHLGGLAAGGREACQTPATLWGGCGAKPRLWQPRKRSLGWKHTHTHIFWT